MVSGAKLIAAIGNFDGVHLGHQHLLQQTVAFAAKHGAQPGVVVFDPHPRRFFRPEAAPFLLSSPAQRDEQLAAHGAKEILSLTFDRTLAAMTPEDFMHEVLAARLGLAGAVTGVDFRFGAGRVGDGVALKALGEKAGLAVKLVEIVTENPGAEKFGSSAVRAALKAGDVKKAAMMLGRPWSARGRVVEGQKLGRTLGFPTANMVLGDLIEPRKGVYAVNASTGGARYKGVANFGRRPTVGSVSPLLEVHLFDFSGDLYGQEIDVLFEQFIRDERKFGGLEALKAQIAADSAAALQMLA